MVFTCSRMTVALSRNCSAANWMRMGCSSRFRNLRNYCRAAMAVASILEYESRGTPPSGKYSKIRSNKSRRLLCYTNWAIWALYEQTVLSRWYTPIRSEFWPIIENMVVGKGGRNPFGCELAHFSMIAMPPSSLGKILEPQAISFQRTKMAGHFFVGKPFLESSRNQSIYVNAFVIVILKLALRSIGLACRTYACRFLPSRWVKCAFPFTWRGYGFRGSSDRIN